MLGMMRMKMDFRAKMIRHSWITGIEKEPEATAKLWGPGMPSSTFSARTTRFTMLLLILLAKIAHGLPRRKSKCHVTKTVNSDEVEY